MKANHNQPQATFRSVLVNAINAERSVGGVCNDLFMLARRCSNVTEFLAKCESEEAWAQSAEAGQSRVDEIPTCWTQAKSDIKAAMNQGHNLNNFPSYSKMKAAKVETNRARQGNPGTNKASPAAGPHREREGVVVQSVDDAIKAGIVVDAKSTELLPPDLRDLIKYLRPLPELSRAKVVKDITRMAKTVHDTYFQSKAEGERRRPESAATPQGGMAARFKQFRKTA